MLETKGHEYFMQQAIRQATIAFDEGEIPVGAVVVCNNSIIAKGYNQTERLNDATAHAEMIAITSASEYMGSKYLNDCILYVTLEPCLMCAGALAHTHIGGVVFGAYDTKGGFTTLENDVLHPRTKLVEGILTAECSQLINEFFALKRDN